MAFPEVDPVPRTRPRPEFHQLETFLKVVEAGSFAAAARKVGTTQQAVSRAIGRLEDFCGADLFERHRGAPLSLTPVGAAILPSARILLHTTDELMSRMVATAQGRSGILTIGFEPWHTGLLCSKIANFAKSHPDVRFRFVEAPFAELRDRLDEHDLDIVFAVAPPRFEAFDFEREFLREARLAVVLPANHWLARKTSLSWTEVRSMGSILSAPGQVLPGRDSSVEQHDVSRSALLDLVANGFGVTIALSSASITRPDLLIRPIRGRSSQVAIEALWRKNDANPLRHRLLTALRGARP